MLVFHDCLLSYNSFLEEISFNVIENNNISSSREKIEQINKSLKQIKKNNKYLKDKILEKEIFGKGKLNRIFDIAHIFIKFSNIRISFKTSIITLSCEQ